MSSDENALLAKCLDFTRSLLECKEAFTLNVKTSFGFVFNFNNTESGNPGAWSRRKKTPSQVKRDQERMKKFRERKLREASGIPEATEAKYELKVDAHEKCSDSDIIEVIETNFYEAPEIKSEIEASSIHLTIKKSNEKQAIMKIDDEFKNVQIFTVCVKENEIARNIIESWKHFHQFDDYAFKNSDLKNLKINIRGVKRLK